MGTHIKTADGGMVSLGEIDFDEEPAVGDIIGTFETDRYEPGGTIKFDGDTLVEVTENIEQVLDSISDLDVRLEVDPDLLWIFGADIDQVEDAIEQEFTILDSGNSHDRDYMEIELESRY